MFIREFNFAKVQFNMTLDTFIFDKGPIYFNQEKIKLYWEFFHYKVNLI